MLRFKRKAKLVYTTKNFSRNIRNYMNYGHFLILVSTTLAIIIGTLYAFIGTPRYTATAIVENQVYSAMSGLVTKSYNNLPSELANTDREIVLLQTHRVLKNTIEQLHLDIIIEPGITITQFDLPTDLLNTKFKLRVLAKQQYELHIQNQILQGQIGQLASLTLSTGETIHLLVTQINVSPGTTIVIEKTDIDTAIKNYLSNIKVAAAADKTNLISINLEGQNAQQITNIVNTFAQAAVADSTLRKQQKIAEALSYLRQQENAIKDHLLQSDTNLNALKANKGGMETTDKMRYLVAQLSMLDKNLQTTEQQMVTMLQTVTKKNPAYLEIATLHEHLLKQRQELSEEIAALPNTNQTVVSQERDNTADITNYQNIMAQIQQLQIMQAAVVGDVHIIELANIPTVPSSYSRWIIILLSAVVGMVLGGIFAVALD